MKKSRVLLLVLDIALIIFAYYLALELRFDGEIPANTLQSFVKMMPLIGLVTVVCFLIVDLYSSLWEYASIREMIDIIRAVTYSMVGVWSLSIILHIGPLPRSSHILAWIMGTFVIGSTRLWWRMVREYNMKRSSSSRALIIGAGKSGLLMARMMKPNVVGFIDDFKDTNTIMGLPVLGDRKDLERILKSNHIDEVIVTASLSGKELSYLIRTCKDSKVVVKVIDKANGGVTPKLRTPSIEDLLGRDPVRMESDKVTAYITGRRILVSGAGGSIGSELCRQIARFRPEMLIAVDFSENNVFELQNELEKAFPQLPLMPVLLDVKDKIGLTKLFIEQRPNVVFHAAAFKHVPMMERYPQQAYYNNVNGTQNMIKASMAANVNTFVFISTDKAVDPANAMGASKRMGELLITQANGEGEGKFTAVRFGNVLGSRGSVIPIFQRQIQAGGPITVTDPEMTRYFMTIPEAAQLVIQAGSMASGGEVFVLDMGNPVKIFDLAEDLIRLSGLTPGKDIEIQISGVRPGEKIEEALFTNDEKLQKTKHSRIMVARENPGDNEFELLFGKFFGPVGVPAPKKAMELVSKSNVVHLPSLSS